MPLPTVQKIAVSNDGGYTLTFKVVDGGGKQYGSVDKAYPIDQSRVVDMAANGCPAGTQVRPVMHASGGRNASGSWVTFQPNGQVQTYRATGSVDAPHLDP